MSHRQVRTIVLGLAFLLAAGVGIAQAASPANVTIDGLIGLGEALESSYIAIWVPMTAGTAISGVTWYNNDGTVPFPEILVQGGPAAQVTTLSGALTVASDVLGLSSGWSGVAFVQPVTTDDEGIYVVFRIPAGSSAEEDGAGGGPAFGYTSTSTGCLGWMSPDGEDWMQIHPSYCLAVLPTVTAIPPGGAAKCNAPGGRRSGGQLVVETEASPEDAVPPVVTGLGSAAPNPFNPRTTLTFSLAKEGPVTLAVYSLRGELVKRLLGERRGAGTHSVEWGGTDEQGRSVASGVYLAHFEADAVYMTQRLVLMR